MPDLLRRLARWLCPPPDADAVAALDGGPGAEPVDPECPRPLTGIRMMRLPVDPDDQAAAIARAGHGLPTANLDLSFCDFDAGGRCVVHDDCHLSRAT